MEIKVFSSDNGDCPYLSSRRWNSLVFYSEKIAAGIYENLLNQGFRRSGIAFYKNNCPNCKRCIPIKIPVDRFIATKSQRRCLKKNIDIEIINEGLTFDNDSFRLYKKFSEERFSTPVEEEEFREFLAKSAVETRMMKYYLNQRLIGVGWVDMLVDSLSSVYFAFDPEIKQRSLGVFSILKEIELAKKLNKHYLHLGFWVKECRTMTYKSNFRPHLLLLNDEWVLC